MAPLEEGLPFLYFSNESNRIEEMGCPYIFLKGQVFKRSCEACMKMRLARIDFSYDGWAPTSPIENHSQQIALSTILTNENAYRCSH